jgi:hypothetical protein
MRKLSCGTFVCSEEIEAFEREASGNEAYGVQYRIGWVKVAL